MTGRAAGFCGGNDTPGFQNPSPGRGLGRGRGLRGGGGAMPRWRRWGRQLLDFAASEEEAAARDAEMNSLRARIAEVQARLEALEHREDPS